MGQLKANIPRGLWRALMDHAERTREPLAHIVNKALADYLQVAHHTLYQVSTATALVEGIYQGAVRVGTLREHGDLGLGTFEDLDGEMVVVDGRFYQVRSDGSVRECGDDLLSPFAVVTRFAPDVSVTLDRCRDLGQLTVRFDALRHTDNVFFALRVDGHFGYVHARAMCRSPSNRAIRWLMSGQWSSVTVASGANRVTTANGLSTSSPHSCTEPSDRA